MKALSFALAGLALSLLAGCIADSAEDSDLPWSSSRNWEGLGPLPSIMTDLPWASNRSWEGIAPIAPSVMDRYE